ncbi:MAG: TRAP transporter large permease, partial [Deltaproteobacteria bacterium]|nr:TRAP transporter large permease [Deltaproteobacteria bacterium]
SIVDLFLAGIGPGIFLALCFIGFCFLYAKFGKGYQPVRKASWRERWDATLLAVPTGCLAAIVIGGIYAGWFTPTESAGIGFTVALVIVYGVITEESIVDLFLAGIGPGIFLALCFIGFCFFYARFGKGYEPVRKASWRERWDATLLAVPTVCLAAIVIGGIYAGWFTPTESAGIGFAVALVIVYAMRRMTWIKLKEAVNDSMKTTVTIFLIIVGAKLFGKAITLYRIPQEISEAITANISGPGAFIMLVCVVLLIMGFFLESLSMLLIMMPVLYPSLSVLGIDPIWFGVLFVVMIECALITPPVGLNLFVIQAVAKSPLSEVIRGVWPFILIMLGTVLLLWFWPDLAIFIPYKL